MGVNRVMTTYRTKMQYVVINWNSLKSIKKAEVKKAKLENQGYNLINNRSDLLVYKNDNYLNKRSKSYDN
tara:strand:- start:397 stop:606 length:210 start_codon:yes stop_codon:yes gene_type:complete